MADVGITLKLFFNRISLVDSAFNSLVIPHLFNKMAFNKRVNPFTFFLNINYPFNNNHIAA